MREALDSGRRGRGKLCLGGREGLNVTVVVITTPCACARDAVNALVIVPGLGVDLRMRDQVLMSTYVAEWGSREDETMGLEGSYLLFGVHLRST